MGCVGKSTLGFMSEFAPMTEETAVAFRELTENRRSSILQNPTMFEIIREEALCFFNDRNFEIWGFTFYERMLSHDAEGNIRDPKSYDEAIAQLQECIRLRGEFMDSHIEDLYRYAVN